MHQNDGNRELELGRFGEYLLKSRGVPEKYAPYYVRWVYAVEVGRATGAYGRLRFASAS
jgi:hypothetical protein